jgi:ABC-type protease/lipase transport system fused ATPase/permease subunit
MSIWAGLVAAFGTVGMVVAGWFAARATKAAAAATARATEAAAVAQAEPEQRRVDLEAFKTIRDDLQSEVRDLRQETTRLRSIVRAFAGYVGELTMQMRATGVEPAAPPDLVNEYNRTGV